MSNTRQLVWGLVITVVAFFVIWLSYRTQKIKPELIIEQQKIPQTISEPINEYSNAKG